VTGRRKDEAKDDDVGDSVAVDTERKYLLLRQHNLPWLSSDSETLRCLGHIRGCHSRCNDVLTVCWWLSRCHAVGSVFLLLGQRRMVELIINQTFRPLNSAIMVMDVPQNVASRLWMCLVDMPLRHI
jgi:hypothetical protein